MAQQMTTAAGSQPARRRDGGEATRTRRLFQPRCDIYETDDRIVVLAELPGVAPEDVDITLERRELTIRGRTPAIAPEGYRQVYAEYEEGDFERVFTIADEIDRDGIKASHKDGLLTLELPKAASAKTRKIAVKTA